MQTQDNRTLFLRLFAQELIINSKPKPLFPEVREIKEEEYIESQIPQQMQEFQIQPKLLTLPPLLQLPPKIPPQPRIIKPKIKVSTQIQVAPIPEINFSENINEFSLGKLDSLLQDPYINMIECTGPGKLILVRAISGIKATKISLSEQEIKETIGKFAQISKIPLMKGVFKAAVGNLLITAILSEFVGSRFIINKHAPE